MYDTSPKDEKLTYSEIEKVNLKLDFHTKNLKCQKFVLTTFSFA